MWCFNRKRRAALKTLADDQLKKEEADRFKEIESQKRIHAEYAFVWFEDILKQIVHKQQSNASRELLIKVQNHRTSIIKQIAVYPYGSRKRDFTYER
ncbi:MAG: hypothetical protein JKX96_04415 [Acinetobacter sp.]|nr:hypothetical protein [Acinetobacter sp.]